MTDLSRLTDLSRPSPASNARGSASPNIYDRMTSHVERSPQSAAFVATGRHGTRSHTWAEMAEWADRLRGGLRERRVSAGDRIAVSMPNGPDLVAVLLAIVAEGGIAVVLPVPNGRRDGSYVGRSLGVWADCQPTLLIETDSLAERRRSFGALAQLPSATAEQLALSEPVSDCRNPTPEAQPVFLQYTSGSTTRPRGVVVTSEMLAANCEQAARVYGDHARDVVVSWVPLYHDMGLVTAVMRPLYFGYTSVLQEPTEFVADPLSWLRAISAHGGTLSSAPDFAYVHCVRRLSPDDFAGLDLSSWRVARSAGEVVRPETMDAFMALTADAGFSPTSFCPSYGMAEATLTVTTCTPEIRPLRITIDGDLLTAGAAVVERASGRTLLSSGLPLPGTSVQIGGAPAVDGVVGELEVSGPQVAHAYWGAELNRTAEGAARTGDLGFVLKGHLFVLGRSDDVFIVNGVNYFQHDIVAACARVVGIRPGRIAAFLDDRDPGRHSVVLIAETSSGVADAARLSANIHTSVLDSLGLIVSRVELVDSGSIPVTTSGKVRVSAARATWLAQHVALASKDGR